MQKPRIGVLVLMLHKESKEQSGIKKPRPLEKIQANPNYNIIFGDQISFVNEKTQIQNQEIDILFDRYPYQKNPLKDPLRLRKTKQNISIPICNPRDFILLCKDKWKFQKYIEQHDIFMPEISKDCFGEYIKKWNGQAIAKPRFGSFGIGIELVNSIPEATRPSVHGFDPTLIQQYIKPPQGYAGIAIRQLIQRNADRSWTYRTIVARCSKIDPIVNASRGASIERAIDILPKNCCFQIESLSRKIAVTLGKLSPYIIEVGLDYVIDESYSPIFIEANAQPKGKLRSLVLQKKIKALQEEHEHILQHPFDVMSKWAYEKNHR